VIHEDELYITGRLKDVIIVGGRNLYPQDIEASVEAAHPWIRPGFTAAFSLERDGREQVVVVAEVARPVRDTAQDGPPSLARIRQRVRMEVGADHGIQLDDVHLVAPASTPRTSSGKVRRRACLALYEQGAFTAAREPAGRALEGIV
jgi:acyl-CoA synthetase (AMP-forming)/AMP-acid ligase II